MRAGVIPSGYLVGGGTVIDPKLLEAINAKGPVKYSFEPKDFENGPVPIAYINVIVFGDQSVHEPSLRSALVSSVDEAEAFVNGVTATLAGLNAHFTLADRVLARAFLVFMSAIAAGDSPDRRAVLERLADLAGGAFVLAGRGKDHYYTPDAWPPELLAKFENLLADQDLPKSVGIEIESDFWGDKRND